MEENLKGTMEETKRNIRRNEGNVVLKWGFIDGLGILAFRMSFMDEFMDGFYELAIDRCVWMFGCFYAS